MSVIEIRPDPARPDRGWLTFGYRVMPCRLGRNGVTTEKHEGDGKTPAGHFHLRRMLVRADRVGVVASRLAGAAIRPDDGWCDDPADASYNRQVRLPYPVSAEAMWRADGAYDIVIVLGHNDNPPVSGRGSAIFLHVAHDDGRPTAGCVALTKDDLRWLAALVGPETTMSIYAA